MWRRISAIMPLLTEATAASADVNGSGSGWCSRSEGCSQVVLIEWQGSAGRVEDVNDTRSPRR